MEKQNQVNLMFNCCIAVKVVCDFHWKLLVFSDAEAKLAGFSKHLFLSNKFSVLCFGVMSFALFSRLPAGSRFVHIHTQHSLFVENVRRTKTPGAFVLECL